MNIVIIEDNPIYQIKLRNTVEQLGYQVIQTIETFEEAETLLKSSEQYNLIICDIVLKDRIIFDIKQWPNVPILFITAFEEINYMKSSLEIKNSWFLVKPFSDLSLKSAIIRLIDKFGKPKDLYITVFGKHKNPIKISINEILFIESEGNYSTVVTNNNNKYAIKRSARLLVNDSIDSFLRIRRSTFINKSKITKVSLVENKIYIGDYSFIVTREFKKNIYEFYLLE